jgi:hypothetical protein
MMDVHGKSSLANGTISITIQHGNIKELMGEEMHVEKLVEEPEEGCMHEHEVGEFAERVVGQAS